MKILFPEYLSFVISCISLNYLSIKMRYLLDHDMLEYELEPGEYRFLVGDLDFTLQITNKKIRSNQKIVFYC